MLTELWSVAEAAAHWGVSESRARAILADRGIKRISGYPADQIQAVVLRQGARTDLLADRLTELLANTPRAGERYSLENIRGAVDRVETLDRRCWAHLAVEGGGAHGEAVDVLLVRVERGAAIEPDWRPILSLAEDAGLVADGHLTEAGAERLSRRRHQHELAEAISKVVLLDEDRLAGNTDSEHREPR